MSKQDASFSRFCDELRWTSGTSGHIIMPNKTEALVLQTPLPDLWCLAPLSLEQPLLRLFQRHLVLCDAAVTAFCAGTSDEVFIKANSVLTVIAVKWISLSRKPSFTPYCRAYTA